MNLVIVCTLGCTWAAYYLCNMQKSSKEKPTSFDDDGNGDGNSLAWSAAWSQNSIHNLIYRNIRADSFVGMSWRALTSLIGFSKMVSRTHSHCGFAQCSNWKFHCSACCFAYIFSVGPLHLRLDLLSLFSGHVIHILRFFGLFVFCFAVCATRFPIEILLRVRS